MRQRIAADVAAGNPLPIKHSQLVDMAVTRGCKLDYIPHEQDDKFAIFACEFTICNKTGDDDARFIVLNGTATIPIDELPASQVYYFCRRRRLMLPHYFVCTRLFREYVRFAMDSPSLRRHPGRDCDSLLPTSPDE
jgi:hypothetical protein